MVTSWLTRSAPRRSNGKPLLLFPRLASLPMMQGHAGRWGGPRESHFPSCTPRSPHLPDGLIPSLATHRDGCHTPSSCCHGRWESFSMPRARMGWGVQDRHVLADAAARAGSSQVWVVGLLRHPRAAPQTSPPFLPPPPFQLGTKPAAIIQAKHVNLADPTALV